MKLICLSGPPRCGKDSIAKELQRLLGGYETTAVLHTAQPVKNAIREMFAISGTLNWYERHKDIAYPIFFGSTYRQEQIAIIQGLQARFGKDILGRMLAQRIKSHHPQIRNFIIADSGRNADVSPLIDLVEFYNEMTIVHIKRDGCSYTDIRSPITIGLVQNLHVENNSKVEDAAHTIYEFVTKDNIKQDNK